MQGHLIGIDVGTTSVKAVMLDAAGRRVSDFSVPYPTDRPAPGRAEQDPFLWLGLVRQALERFSAMGETVAGLCITSQVNTHVFADADLEVLHPAIVWQDGRAASVAATLDASISTDEKIEWLGAPIPVDASHALSRMAWMQAERPDLWSRCAHVLLPRDWIVARLTGRLACDAMSSVGLVTPGLRYADPLIARVPGAAARLVPLADPLSIVGAVGAGWPLVGTPVVLGMMDAWASLFGLGVARDGDGMYLSGTSEVMGVVSGKATGEPGVITFPEWRGVRFHAGPTQSGGASLDWVARLLGREVEAALAMAGPVADGTPLFLPHLAGERAPIWDSASRGAFVGLSAATGPGDMVAAVLEGVAFSARLAFEALERSGAVRVPVICAGGGGFASDLWAQIRADAFGRPLLRMAGRDPAAVGAAVMAGAGIGAMPDLAGAAEALVQSERMFEPDPDASARADRRFAIWRGLYGALRPINHALADRGLP